MTEQRRDSDTLMLVLAYLGILALIPYLTVTDSDYVRWHAKQGLTLTGVWFAAMLVSGILMGIPGLGVLIALISPFFSLAVVAIFIVGMVKAIQGERWPIPIVADLAEKW
jgi:uncharacterized membrane protein